MSYIATIIDKNCVEVSFSNDIPDFVHAVKYNPYHEIELIFDAESNWTTDLEDEAMSLLMRNLEATDNPYMLAY